MNELNCASLTASKKLYEAGIVLETDAVWRKKRDKTGYYLSRKALYHRTSDVPAPSMAEVWRELPEHITKGGTIQYLEMGKTGSKTYAAYDFDDDYILFDNPTDALINLLIWLKGEGNDQ